MTYVTSSNCREGNSWCSIAHYESPLGKILLAGESDCLIGLWFEGQKYFASTIDHEFVSEKWIPVFDVATRWLDCYFASRRHAMVPNLRLYGTPFQLRVWNILLGIPYGKTMTYGEIAQLMTLGSNGKYMSAQAVGQAVARNPISLIVPCHRVVGRNCTPTGYAGGIDCKISLLDFEKNASDSGRCV